MSKKNLKDLLKETRKKVRRMRDRVNELKERQAEKQMKQLKSATQVKPMPKKEKYERVMLYFSMADVAKATLVVLGLFILAQFLFEVKEILILLFVSLFLAAALDSIIDWFEQRKIPRALGVLIVYLLFFVLLAIIISTMVPLVASQLIELAGTVKELLTNLVNPENKFWDLPYTESLRQMLIDFFNSIDQEQIITNIQGTLEQIGKQLQSFAGNTWSAIKTIFDGVFNAIVVMVLTFFMVVDEKGMQKFLVSLFPARYANYIAERSNAVKESVGFWLRGQIKLMVLIGVVTFVGLTLLGVEYAVTLALLAGITELVPVVGPIIAMIPALLIGLNESMAQTFWIFILYIVIQQLEGNIIVPMVMNKALGLSPIVIILAMLIGFKFLGVVGVIISVPVATALSIFFKDYAAKSK